MKSLNDLTYELMLNLKEVEAEGYIDNMVERGLEIIEYKAISKGYSITVKGNFATIVDYIMEINGDDREMIIWEISSLLEDNQIATY